MSQAAEKGDKVFVELLLKNGAQPDLEDEEGCTPLSRAHNSDVIQLLRTAGATGTVQDCPESGAELKEIL